MEEMWLLITRKVHQPGFVVAINTIFVIKLGTFSCTTNLHFQSTLKSKPSVTIQYNTYLIDRSPHAGAFQGQWNTTKRRNETTTAVKNPNWPEANQLAIYKCSWEVEPGTTRIKFNKWSEQVLNPGSPDLKASTLTTGPHCLLLIIIYL